MGRGRDSGRTGSRDQRGVGRWGTRRVDREGLERDRQGNTEVGTDGRTEGPRDSGGTGGRLEELGTQAGRGAGSRRTRGPWLLPLNGGADRLGDRGTGRSWRTAGPSLAAARFLSFENGNRSGKGGREGQRALEVAQIPRPGPPHSPLGAGPGARGRGGWGPAPSAGPKCAHKEGSEAGSDQDAPGSR